MRLLSAALAAFLVPAAPARAITQPTVTISSPSSATGARTSYAVAFSLGSAISGTGRIMLVLPAGTGSAGGTVVSGATQVGTCGFQGGTEFDCTATPGQTIPTTPITVNLNGVTNGP